MCVFICFTNARGKIYVFSYLSHFNANYSKRTFINTLLFELKKVQDTIGNGKIKEM